jgi:hypothetical protein
MRYSLSAKSLSKSEALAICRLAMKGLFQGFRKKLRLHQGGIIFASCARKNNPSLMQSKLELD